MRYFVWLSLPLVLGGCLGAAGGGQPPVNPSRIEGGDFVLECKEKSPVETAFLCRPIQVQ